MEKLLKFGGRNNVGKSIIGGESEKEYAGKERNDKGQNGFEDWADVVFNKF